MRQTFFTLLACATLAGALSSTPANAYFCEPAKPGGNQAKKCVCLGAEDCRGMRKSGMCAGVLECSGQTSCSCVAARKKVDEGPASNLPSNQNRGTVTPKSKIPRLFGN